MDHEVNLLERGLWDRAGSAPKALRPMRKRDNLAGFNDSIRIEHWLNHSQSAHSTEVSGSSATGSFVQEEYACAHMPSACTASLEEFDSKGWEAPLLTALAGMDRQHLLLPHDESFVIHKQCTHAANFAR